MTASLRFGSALSVIALATMVGGCASPTATNAESCATGYINEFGAKAFRRPVAPSEVTDLMAVYRIGAASPGTYAEGIDLVTRAILQAPGFLYLTALGAPGSTIDVPLHFKDAAFVRTHFDAMEVRLGDAPRANEILVALVVTDGGRPHARVGGLTVTDAKKEDGLR